MSGEELNIYVNEKRKLVVVEMNMLAPTKAGEMHLVTQHLDLGPEDIQSLIDILQEGLSTISETEEL